MFDEYYGEVTKEQYRLYRKYNISPVDHDDLKYEYGDSATIVKVLKVNKGMPSRSYTYPVSRNINTAADYSIFE